MVVELHVVAVLPVMGSYMLVGVYRSFQELLRGDYYVVVDHDVGCRMVYDYFPGAEVHDWSGWRVDHVWDTVVCSPHLCRSRRGTTCLRAHIDRRDSVHDPQESEGSNGNVEHRGDINYRVDDAPCLVGKLLVWVAGFPMSGRHLGVVGNGKPSSAGVSGNRGPYDRI